MTINSLERYLTQVDNTFPVPLSNKTNIFQYANKLYNKANLFSLEMNGEVLGLVAGYVDNCTDNNSYISIVSVLPKYQGKGLAKALVNSYLEYAKTKRICCVHLYADKDNHNAQKLYESLGFEKIIIDNETRPNDIHYSIKLR